MSKSISSLQVSSKGVSPQIGDEYSMLNFLCDYD